MWGKGKDIALRPRVLHRSEVYICWQRWDSDQQVPKPGTPGLGSGSSDFLDSIALSVPGD